MTDSTEQGARLEKLIEALGNSQVSMAESIGISQSYISQMVSGSRNISRNVLHAITKTFQNVNVRWLLTGDGEMFLQKVLATDSNGVSEPEVKYEARPADPLGALRELLDEHGRRLAKLEEEVRWLRGEDEEEKKE